MNEHQEQAMLISFLRSKRIKHTAIVNSFFPAGISVLRIASALKRKIKNAILGMIAKFKKEGWNKGLCDVLILCPCGDGKKRLVFIEMKISKTMGKRGSLIGGGKVSEEQKEWIESLNECLEVGAYVAYGADEAIHIIESLMKQKEF